MCFFRKILEKRRGPKQTQYEQKAAEMGHGWQWQCGDHGTSATAAFVGILGGSGPMTWISGLITMVIGSPQFVGFWEPFHSCPNFMAEINGGFLRSLRIYDTIRSPSSKMLGCQSPLMG